MTDSSEDIVQLGREALTAREKRLEALKAERQYLQEALKIVDTEELNSHFEAIQKFLRKVKSGEITEVAITDALKNTYSATGYLQMVVSAVGNITRFAEYIKFLQGKLDEKHREEDAVKEMQLMAALATFLKLRIIQNKAELVQALTDFATEHSDVNFVRLPEDCALDIFPNRPPGVVKEYTLGESIYAVVLSGTTIKVYSSLVTGKKAWMQM